MRDPEECLRTHTLRPLTPDDVRGTVTDECLVLGAIICPECGLI